MTGCRKGGIAAMELVARDLKALWLYTDCALSFAGVEYEILRHELRPDQIAIYDRYADDWANIHCNMARALELTSVLHGIDNSTPNKVRQALDRPRFDSNTTPFFGHLPL